MIQLSALSKTFGDRVLLDAVNIPAFEPVWLHPGETYRHAITFRFTTDR